MIFYYFEKIDNDKINSLVRASGFTSGVILFSYISRYLSVGVMTGEEIGRVMSVWNAPVIGFFCYGEFGRSKGGKHEFHNNTCCVVVLKEKK
jgi:hypothetical protein